MAATILVIGMLIGTMIGYGAGAYVALKWGRTLMWVLPAGMRRPKRPKRSKGGWRVVGGQR